MVSEKAALLLLWAALNQIVSYEETELNYFFRAYM